MAEPVLVTDQLCKRFTDGTYAVRDFCLTVQTGTIHGLLGGNGAGKTTTLGMMLGLIKPTSGAIKMLGYDMTSAQRSYALQQINFSSPYFDLPNRLTVRQNLTVYGRLYDIPDLDDRLLNCAKQMGVDTMLDKITGDLSAGQRTRVALAKSILNQPRILLLDEPTASLDPDTADIIRSFLGKYRDETNATIILASHNMYEVERLCDRVSIMSYGKIVVDDSPSNLLNQFQATTMEDVFLSISRSQERQAKR